ncbi:aldolase [Siminovitchia acidinfaciens]|uniref:Aldolase n=1 Tax=Siminovitchia acidinfaciens TaxID=2321395 RepID=A0A429XW68_9BACI|nr:aldolase [Siminovitchia acidinfaciens]RST72535.1 aldolase [Siminovitchia acidinfaciens]
MIPTLKTDHYKAFGLCIKSAIHLPELQEVPSLPDPKDIDIVVELEELSEQWHETLDTNRYFSVQENAVLFHVPETAIYRIEKGEKITVSPFPETHLDHTRLYLLGTCMGVILMQRKILPLHGSAVVIDGQAYAIIGDSGAGKSTLAYAFLKKGYQLISDDVIPVNLSKDGIPFVTPAYPQQKLWEESLQAFNMESDDLRPIIEREKKFAVPVDSQFAKQPIQLAGIYELIKTSDGPLTVTPITNLMRFQTLFNHTYRNFLLSRLGLMEWHFQITAKIIQSTGLYQLRRPVNRFTADDFTRLILNTISKRGIYDGCSNNLT